MVRDGQPSWLQTSLVAQTIKRLPTMQETWVQSLGQEDPLEKEMATHSSILAWKILWMEEPCRLQVHRVAQSRTRLSDFTSLERWSNSLWSRNLNSVCKKRGEQQTEPLQVYNECKKQCQIPSAPLTLLHSIQQIHSFSLYLSSMYNQSVAVLGTGDTVRKFYNFYFWWLLHMSKIMCL